MKKLSLLLMSLATSTLAAPYIIGNGIRPHQSNTFPDAGGVNFGALQENADGGLKKSNGFDWYDVVSKDLIPQCNSPTQALAFDTTTQAITCQTLTLSDGGASGVTVISGTSPVVAVYDGGGGYDISLTTVPVSKGGTGLTSISNDQILRGVGGAFGATGLPACFGTGAALTYNNGPQTFGCNSLTVATLDAGTVLSIAGVSPVVATPDGGGGYAISIAALRETVHAVYVNNVTVASTTYGGEVFPSQATTVTAARFRVRTAGAGGSTNFTFRASDGTNNCDCTFACNSAVGNYRNACSGSCVFAASASMTYSVPSIGDCTTGPDIQGNVIIEATVTP